MKIFKPTMEVESQDHLRTKGTQDMKKEEKNCNILVLCKLSRCSLSKKKKKINILFLTLTFWNGIFTIFFHYLLKSFIKLHSSILPHILSFSEKHVLNDRYFYRPLDLTYIDLGYRVLSHYKTL